MGEHVLHVGQRGAGAAYDIDFEEKQLYRHALLVGQSGCGKSTLLARMLEELVLHSQARIVILDLNSDFAKLDVADGAAWSDSSRLRMDGCPYDESEGRFSREWKGNGGGGVSACFRPKHNLSMTVSRLRRQGFREMLGLDPLREPEALWLADRVFDHARRGSAALWPLDTWTRLRRRIVEWAHGLVTNDDCGEQGTFGSLPTYIASTKAVRAAQQIANGLADALRCQIWNNDKTASDFDDYWKASSELRRVTCIDLGAVGDSVGLLVTARFVLDRLWELAKRERESRASDRRPIFIVVDEAHNLAPPVAESPAAAGLLNMLQKTAAEGRKEGLYLFLATQRPQKLHQNVASECDNFALMRLVPKGDIDWLRRQFSFVPENVWGSAPMLDRGEAFFLGNWSIWNGKAKVATRRTVEGGADLKKDRMYL